MGVFLKYMIMNTLEVGEMPDLMICQIMILLVWIIFGKFENLFCTPGCKEVELMQLKEKKKLVENKIF